MSDWQPIESAPKDGTDVLIVGRNGRVMTATWVGGAWDVDMTGNGEHNATHWMPLPVGPNAEPDIRTLEQRKRGEAA